MDRRILFVSSEQSFLVKTMIKGLNEAGFETVLSQPDIVEIQLIQNLPTLFIIYLEGDINAFNGTLKYITKIISESSENCLLYLIGNQIEIDVAKEVVPHSLISDTFTRPVNMKDVVSTINNTLLSGDRRKRILVVDDDAVLLRTMKNWLSKSYDVYMANSGMNAISFLAQNTVDLILLDYEMPVASGLQVFEMIKGEPKTANIPVIFLTAKDDRETVMKVLAAKPDKYLLKTMAPDALVQSVHDFFKGK